MFVQFVGVRDTRHVESLSCTDERPESCPVGLSDDIGRYTVATSIPTGRDLSSHKTTELNSLGDQDTCTPLELNKPLATFSGPHIAFVAVLILVLLSFEICSFERLKVMDEFNLLMEDLLFGIIASEELGLWNGFSKEIIL